MLDSILKPKSIAIVGVSMEPAKVGHQIFANLSSFDGPVYPINPKHKKILGTTAYPDVLSIPNHIDLVIIATPAPTVEDIVNQCIDKKVKGIIIITAGFAETSKVGKAIQERIIKKCRANHIEVLGPNTLGSVNPYEQMNASFAPADIRKGTIGLISQSGAMLTTVFSEFASRGVGCSFALSLGNSAGVTATDALLFAKDDPHTHVIAMYLESLPIRRSEVRDQSSANEKSSPNLKSLASSLSFFQLCKEISRTKPIVLLKGGLTSEGMKASLSHTAALATDSALLKDAQYQFGFTFVETIEQFFETTFFLDKLLGSKRIANSEQRIEKKNSQLFATHYTLPTNLMILTNAGGPGVNSIDVASKLGVDLAHWSGKSLRTFARELPRVKPANPTDLLGDAGVHDIEMALTIADEDPLVESVLLIVTPQAVTDISGITKMLIQRTEVRGQRSANEKSPSNLQPLTSSLSKPLVVSLMGGEQLRTSINKLRAAGITTVEYANEGVEIIAYAIRTKKAQRTEPADALERRLEKIAIRTTSLDMDNSFTRRNLPLNSNRLQEVYLLLESYGFTLPRCAIASSEEQLTDFDELDPSKVFPLVAKTANLNLKHKAAVGGVILGIETVEQAKAAYKKLTKLGKDVLFQEVIEDAVEVIIDCKRDPVYGAFIAVGSGGSLSNILADRSYVFLPAGHKDVKAAIMRTKLVEQLSAEQRTHVTMCIERFMLLLAEHPEISELEINPLMVTKHAAYVADVKVDLTKSNPSRVNEVNRGILQP